VTKIVKRLWTRSWLRLGTWLGAALGIALVIGLGFLVYRERYALGNYLAAAKPSQLLSVVGWYTIDLMIYFAVWVAILQKLGGRTDIMNHFRIFCLANAARRLPGTLWYVGSRALLYKQANVPAKTVVIASGIEVVVIWCSGILAALPLVFVTRPEYVWPWSVAALGFLVAILNPKALRWALLRASPEWQTGSVGLLHVYLWILGDAIGWFVGGMFLFAILTVYQSLSLTAIPSSIGAWTIAGTISMLVFFLPSNFGITEVTLVALLSGLVPTAIAVLAALSARILATLLDLVWGGVALMLQIGFRR
jgi:glycosyltransferase 2 family protein